MKVFNRDLLELIFSYTESSTPEVCLANAFDFATNRIREIEEDYGFSHHEKMGIDMIFHTSTTKSCYRDFGSLIFWAEPVMGTDLKSYPHLRVERFSREKFKVELSIIWENCEHERWEYKKIVRVKADDAPFESFDMLHTLPRRSNDPFGELIMAVDSISDDHDTHEYEEHAQSVTSNGIVVQFQSRQEALYTARDMAGAVLQC